MVIRFYKENLPLFIMGSVGVLRKVNCLGYSQLRVYMEKEGIKVYDRYFI